MRVRELVGLDADKADDAEIAVTSHLRNKLVAIDPFIGLVDGRQLDSDIGTKNIADSTVRHQGIDRRQRIRWHRRPERTNDVSIVIVMRCLDQDDVEPSMR
jgi:hypothetical protein